ncbi:sensor histidine kinase [Enterococcus hirae]|nr:sensor histidine kinase [Enterococcus hirae]
MRYLYQQLLAFCGMIAMIILIVGVSFTQLTKQTIEENNYQQLFGYAESVEKTTQTYTDTFPQLSQDQAFQNALLLTEQVLSEQNVNFIFYR